MTFRYNDDAMSAPERIWLQDDADTECVRVVDAPDDTDTALRRKFSTTDVDLVTSNVQYAILRSL